MSNTIQTKSISEQLNEIYHSHLNKNRGMWIETKTVTPEYARELLGKNTHNRNVSKMLVDKYARDMALGKWSTTGQTISIGQDGRLIDGQHRLLAVIRSGAKIEFIIVHNVPEESFVNYDIGKKRTASDVLSIDGVKNTRTTASVIRKYLAMINGKTGSLFGDTRTTSIGSGGISNDVIRDYYHKHEYLINDVCGFSKSCYDAARFFSPGEIGGIILYLNRKKGYSLERVYVFFKKLFMDEDTENETANNNTDLLRNTYIREMLGANRLTSATKLSYMVKCWNANMSNKRIKLYRKYNDEELPDFI